MPRAVKGAAKPQKKNGYALPESIPEGEVLTDLSKKQWKVGLSIGKGGFGEIYTVSKYDKPLKNPNDYEYVLKIEPHENGPLFIEMHFYMRNAREDDVKNFMKKKKLKNLGMPYLIANGSHDINGVKHRFIIIPRYGKDIYHYFLQNGNKLPIHTIYRLALQMIDVYEFMHSCNFAHCDLKSSNILLGRGKDGAQQAYLVDFGLASRYTTTDFKPDPKKAHNGTVEYLSRDAHQGVITMRGDIEVLGYNILEWSGAKLPWVTKKLLKNAVKVQKEKEAFIQNINQNLKDLYQNNIPEPIKQFFNYLITLKYNDTPDYDKCRKIFLNGLVALKKPNSGNLDLIMSKTQSPIPAKIKEKQLKSDNSVILDDDFENGNDSPDVSPQRKVKINPKKNIIKSSPLKRKQSPQKNDLSPDSTQKRQKVSPRTKSSSKNISIHSTPTSNTRTGKTIINDDLTPNPSSSKTYEFNFELDVSMDANVVINVKRKKADKNQSKESPKPKVNIRRVKTDDNNTSLLNTSKKRNAK